MSAEALLKRFAEIEVLVVGDLMLDCFLWGSASRISPEAPVPVVNVDREEFFPGGAANVARNLAPFCKRVSAMGRLGSDPAGGRLWTAMGECGVDLVHSLVSDTLPTSCKTRVVARQQQLLRFDREVIECLSPGDHQVFVDRFREIVAQYDVVIVQDYAKGLVGQSLLDEITKACRENQTLVVGDPNPRNPLQWRGLDAVKPNRSEAFVLAGEVDVPSAVEPKDDPKLREVSEILLKRWEAKRLLITLGDQGMIHYSDSGETLHVPTRAQQVFDVSGAGDTAIAFYALGLAAGLPDRSCVELANAASGVVVAKLGTAFVTPEELRALNL